MKKSGALLLLVLFVGCFFSFVPESRAADVMLLIDSSGSMRKTDPHDSRKTAARLFISLLDSHDRAGIVSFGDTAKLLLPLTQNTKENRQAFINAINKVTSREFSTDIYAGVKKGFDELKPSGSDKKVLVLMSDGKLTLGSKEKEAVAFSNLSALLPELAKSGMTLSTIAFSELADAKFLEDLARAGGGFFKLALSEEDIHVIFASMFEKIKSPDTVPFDGDSFSLDKDIKEAIVFVSKKGGTSTTLIEPSGKKNTPAKFGKNIQWFEAKLFDLITVNDPQPGKWKVNLSKKEGNKVFVLTNLSLKSSFNSSFVKRNEKVKGEMWLERDGGVLNEKEVLDQITFSADLAGPDGKSSKIPLQAGGQSFSFEFAPPETGDYTLTLGAEGKTFKRVKAIQFKTVEPEPASQAQKTEPKKETAVAVTDWRSVLRKFGAINRAPAELALFLSVLTIYLFFRNRKHKDLYLKTLRKLNDLKSERSTEPVENPPPREESLPESMPERVVEQQPLSAPIESIEAGQSVGDESMPEQGRLRRLQRMVNFQKNTIVELMCFKDMFDGAKKRMASLQQSNSELQEKIRVLAGGGAGGAGIAESAAAVEENNQELEKFISVLDSENARLSGKFQVWEDEFKRIAADAEVSAEAHAEDDAVYAEIRGEKDALAAKVRDAEVKIEEKSKLLASMQTQYEELEKEYMILYRQQQQQEEGGQPH